jgi:predicted site-specific integrase-resolvase
MPLSQAASYLGVCQKMLRRYVYEGYVTPDERGWFSRAELDACRERIKKGTKTDGAH